MVVPNRWIGNNSFLVLNVEGSPKLLVHISAMSGEYDFFNSEKNEEI